MEERELAALTERIFGVGLSEDGMAGPSVFSKEDQLPGSKKWTDPETGKVYCVRDADKDPRLRAAADPRSPGWVVKTPKSKGRRRR